MQLQEYKPMLEVNTYSGDRYYIPEANKAKFIERINIDRFIEIGGSVIACRDIKSVKPPENKDDLVLIDYPKHIREAVLAHAKERFKEMLKYPKPETLKMWAERITNGESLTETLKYPVFNND